MALPQWYRPLYDKGIVPPVLAAGEINDRHKGELIFVFGNGPSLWDANAHRKALENFATIGTALSFYFIDTDYLPITEKGVWVYCAGKLLSFEGAVLYPHYHNKPLWQVPVFTHFACSFINPSRARLNRRFEQGVSVWGGAMMALDFAYIMGAKEIALLGVDLYSNEHFYTGHEQEFNSRFINDISAIRFPVRKEFPHVVPRMQIWPQLAAQLESEGVKVWNCSEKSALTCFEKMPIAEVLERHKGEKKKAYPGWEAKMAAFQKEAKKART